MRTRQVSVFVENKKGRLAEVTALLSREGVNIRALSLADTADFGVLRLIVGDPDRCLDALKRNGFVAQETDVVAVEVADQVGGLNSILELFGREDVNVEYMYAFVERKTDNAILVFKLDANAKAVEKLTAAGITVLSDAVIREI